MTLDLDDIQGNVLHGYRHPEAAFMFLHVRHAAAGRRLLRTLAEEVTPASQHKPAAPLNVALTANGLRALNLDVARLPGEFLQGMAGRADRLGDTGPSAPVHWEKGLGDGTAHLLVTLYDHAPEALAERVERIGALAAADEIEQVACEYGSRAALGRSEHFGYADGFSQPGVAGQPGPQRPGDGVKRWWGGWRPLKAGEFILGHPDEDGGAPVPPICSNGTFMVFRKLEQDVARFHGLVADVATEQFGGDTEYVAAKLMGRWRDGAPVIRAPHTADPDLAADRGRVNDFRYGRDRSGRRCPLGAHVRRANPRDALVGGQVRTTRHRIIRRGNPVRPADRRRRRPARAAVRLPERQHRASVRDGQRVAARRQHVRPRPRA